MNNFYTIESSDSEWNNIIKKAKIFDFYHTQAYNQLYSDKNSILCIAEFGVDFIAIPLIIREIENSDYFDCTSIYGYAGPVSSLLFSNIPQKEINYFKENLNLFFKEQKIISVFSRLHPLIDYGNLFNNFGNIVNLNKTVNINLNLTLEKQRKQYRKSNKSEINQLKNRHGINIVKCKDNNSIAQFISIYNETMLRVNATENYFFTDKYFHDFLKNDSFDCELLLAKKEEEIIAGAIFTINKNIMQYHLAGTKKEYMKLTPMKLILDEARLLGKELNLSSLHLGGGTTNNEDDPLFRFKSGFSKEKLQFKVWQKIIDKDIYEKLSKKNKTIKNINFFPLYRA